MNYEEKNQLAKEISDELWEKVNMEGCVYRVNNANRLVDKMMQCDYQLAYIPDEFGFFYPSQYLDYAAFAINKDIKQVMGLSDLFINKKCKDVYDLFISLLINDCENEEYIGRKLALMQEKNRDVEIMESGLAWYARDKKRRQTERTK